MRLFGLSARVQEGFVSEFGDRDDELLVVTLVAEIVVVLSGRAAAVGRQTGPDLGAVYHAGVGLPVLLVHDHVDYGVDAGGEV